MAILAVDRRGFFAGLVATLGNVGILQRRRTHRAKHGHDVGPVPPPRFEPITLDDVAGWVYPGSEEQDYGPLEYWEVIPGEDGTPELVIVPRWRAPQVLESGPQPIPLDVEVEPDVEITRKWRSRDVQACRLCKVCRANDTGSRATGIFECRISLDHGAIPADVAEDQDRADEFAALWSERHNGPLPESETGGQQARYVALPLDVQSAAELAAIWWGDQDPYDHVQKLAEVYPGRWVYDAVREATRDNNARKADPWGRIGVILEDRRRDEGGGR